MEQLPQYICHKKVRAAKIERIDAPAAGTDQATIITLEAGLGSRVYSARDLMRKPKPSVGWYLVEYENDYFSFSPAVAFEDGYSLETPVNPNGFNTPADKLARILRTVYIGFGEAELYISGGIDRDRYHAWVNEFLTLVEKDFPL